MAYVDWMIRGPIVGACSCAYGCPCEFMARPTHGDCFGLEIMEIAEGHFADVRLDGLRHGALYRWPGPVHEGKGVAQGVIDARATAAQREALLTILGGKEQVPTSKFNIYGSTIEREIDPVFAPIELDLDLAGRRASARVPGILELTLEPIRNPVTGKVFPAAIVLPEGFEYRRAEMASGRFSAPPPWDFNETGVYGALFEAAYGPQGIIA